MGKFSDFAKEHSVSEDAPNKSKEKVEDYMNKYSNLSQEELMKEFLKVSQEKKKNGEVTVFKSNGKIISIVYNQKKENVKG